MKTHLLCSATLLLVSAATSTLCAQGPAVTPLPIPPGFDFPADQARLELLRDNQDVAGMRKHSWMVFAGMTQKAPGGEAIWETWHSVRETFTPGPLPQGVHSVQRQFVKPRQFQPANQAPIPQAAGQSLASFILFNGEGFKHIRTEGLYQVAKLDAINQGFPASTPTKQRQIKDFPTTAMSLKAVWWAVKKNARTGLPIWDDVPPHANQPPMPPSSWSRAVAVDTTGNPIPAGETATVTSFGQARPGSRVVPLSNFYSFPVTADILQDIRIAQGDSTIDVGDHLLLVALHMTTKEIPDWVWATFWWHDQATVAPFGGDQPTEVAGVWRNYRMNTAYSMDLPKESDHLPKVTFNPWLEARFPDGVNSNCMTCHRRATWPLHGFLPVTRGTPPETDPIFQGSTKLDFLWSVAFEAQ